MPSSILQRSWQRWLDGRLREPGSEPQGGRGAVRIGEAGFLPEQLSWEVEQAPDAKSIVSRRTLSWPSLTSHQLLTLPGRPDEFRTWSQVGFRDWKLTVRGEAEVSPR